MSKETPARADGLPLTTPEGHELQWIRASVVRNYSDPFSGCWMDIDSPLRLEEVDECLATGKERLHEPTGWDVMALLTSSQRAKRRRQHIEKVAWFVRHGFQRPIEVDVGIPFMDCYVRYKVQDGNHRLAAALYRCSRYGEDPLLPLSVAGDVEYAKELGLWEKASGAAAKRARRLS